MMLEKLFKLKKINKISEFEIKVNNNSFIIVIEIPYSQDEELVYHMIRLIIEEFVKKYNYENQNFINEHKILGDYGYIYVFSIPTSYITSFIKDDKIKENEFKFTIEFNCGCIIHIKLIQNTEKTSTDYYYVKYTGKLISGKFCSEHAHIKPKDVEKGIINIVDCICDNELYVDSYGKFLYELEKNKYKLRVDYDLETCLTYI